jgi:hypothetical protein
MPVQGDHHGNGRMIIQGYDASNDACGAKGEQAGYKPEQFISTGWREEPRVAARQDQLVRGPAQLLEVVHRQRTVVHP